jgi:hypothetical protein
MVVGAKRQRPPFLAGLNAANVGIKWKPDEIARQIQLVRKQPGAGGEIFYHLRNLEENQRWPT